MDRLTHKRPDGRIETTGMSYSEIHMDYVPSARINDYYDMRLAAYEDIGLTPKEIAELVNKSRSGEFFDAVELAQIAVNTQRCAELANDNARLRAELEQCRGRAEAAEWEAMEGDHWMQRAIEYQESGGCPICFGTDEEGHKKGYMCYELEERAEQAEAQAAAMREALEHVRGIADDADNGRLVGNYYLVIKTYIEKSLTPDAGAALLAELHRLRALKEGQ